MLSTLLIVKLIAAAFYLFIRLARRSTVNSLPALAHRRGWRYQAQAADLPEPYEGTPFGTGYDRTVQNLLTGSHRGRTITAFEYAFFVGSGRKQEAEVYTVVAVSTPTQCPMLDVSQDGPGPGAPTHELVVEHEAFTEKFIVRTEDDRFAFDVLRSTTLDWMLGDQRATTFPIRFHRNTVLSWEPGMLDIGRMLAMLDYLCDHLDRVPERVWS